MEIEIPPELPPELAAVITLPVKPRNNDNERVLTEVHNYACMHKRFTVDERLQEVVCRDCKVKLNPMYALLSLSRQENRYHELHARYQDELARLAARSKTKCEHCDKMTRISRA